MAPNREKIFLEKWKKDYPWLKYEEGEDDGKGKGKMTCAMCTKFKKEGHPYKDGFASTDGNRNYRKTTLERHEKGQDHILAKAAATRKPKEDLRAAFGRARQVIAEKSSEALYTMVMMENKVKSHLNVVPCLGFTD